MTDTLTLVAHRPRTVSLKTVSEETGLSLNAVRRAIRQDTEERLTDDIRRVPGGRVEGASYYVIAHQFERVFGIRHESSESPIRRRKAS